MIYSFSLPVFVFFNRNVGAPSRDSSHRVHLAWPHLLLSPLRCVSVTPPLPPFPPPPPPSPSYLPFPTSFIFCVRLFVLQCFFLLYFVFLHLFLISEYSFLVSSVLKLWEFYFFGYCIVMWFFGGGSFLFFSLFTPLSGLFFLFLWGFSFSVFRSTFLVFILCFFVSCCFSVWITVYIFRFMFMLIFFLA